MRYLDEFETYKLNEAGKAPVKVVTPKKSVMKSAAPVAKSKGTTKPATTTTKKATKAREKTVPKTIEDVKKEYSNLLENIKKQAKVPTITTALSKQTLDTVKFIQAFLIVKGNAIKADGQYGDKSQKALAIYQASVSLTADGVCGLKTWVNILKEFGLDASNFTAIKVEEANSSTKVDKLTNASLSKINKTYQTIIDNFKQSKTVPLLSDKLVKQKLQEVSFLQDYLLFTKYSTGKVDGQFGGDTKTAVTKLQTKHNLKADGVVGINTWRIILKDFGIASMEGFKATNSVTTAKEPVQIGMSDLKAKYIALLNESQKNKKLPLLSTAIVKIKLDYVSLLQDYLNIKKYKTGVDGQFGEGTKKTVIKWQTKTKLGADGAIGLKSWSAIMKDFNLSVDGFAIYTPEAKQSAIVEPTKAAPIAAVKTDESFYNLSAAEDATFMKTTFSTEKGDITGDKLAVSDYMKTDAIADLIKTNPDSVKVSLILKKAYVLMGNKTPIKLLMQNTGLREETTNPILKLGEPRVIGEMVYYGLRGVGKDKGIDTAFIIKRVIAQLASWGDSKKSSIEAWFNQCAQNGDLEKYRDTDKYPLRKWLYDQFRNDDPYKWMNHITKDSYTLNRNIVAQNAQRAKAVPKQEPLPLYADDNELYPTSKNV